VTAIASVGLRTRAGTLLDTSPERWVGEVLDEDARVLSLAQGPVLDVGCGPGRHVAWLTAAGVPALGIDLSARAVEQARARGARAVRQCIFEPMAGGAAWRTILLLDGNLGIGGDPSGLLHRCAALLAPGGLVLAEVAPPGTQSSLHEARLELDGHLGPWFAWATVAVDDITRLARPSGLTPTRVWEDTGRWFVRLEEIAAT
jgi:SAM-dependent methyltransferase